MTDPTADERLADAKRDYRALNYGVALLTGDRTLELEVYRQVHGSAAILDLLSRSARVLVENLTDEARDDVADVMRARIARLFSRFGERLDPSEPPPLPAAEMDRTVRRLLDDEDGAL